ncbi:hypothetical protein M413DRAFT_369498 [Hebeloma cylindrosporum]|uniref:Uncharacterized protein n=1 Tax=Hebeloma cylindrosporum TaxID=76867 RepID=A0A0C3BE58_HEBCY|nr:hypothetical protein M413DRAFT_369498 [Hebeloma cylindrosporum h7]
MSLYPDNENRANRVRQLSNDIAGLQEELLHNAENVRLSDAAAFDLLNVLSAEAGFMKLGDYAGEAVNQLTAEERARFNETFGELGAPFNPILLIVDGIQGSHARTMLQHAIVELCCRRFVVKQIQRQAYAILDFKNDVKSIIQMKSLYDELIQEDRAAGEGVATNMKATMDKIKANLKSSMDEITSNNIWELLDKQDASQTSWKNEDPNLEKILEWIRDHA